MSSIETRKIHLNRNGLILTNNNKTKFRTSKEPLREDSTWGDLVKNFTDITRGTELYSKMISQDISPHWVNEPEIVSHDTVL